MSSPNNRVAAKALTNALSLRVVYALRHGALRFNELERRVDAPHPPALSSRLKLMARDGLVERRVLRLEPPAHIEYALTPLGMDLAKSAASLVQWVDHHLPEVEIARERYRVLRAQNADTVAALP